MDQTVVLTDMEWQETLFILANAEGKGITWALVNPKLMKIGEQLRAQQTAQAAVPPGNGLDVEAERVPRRAQRQ